MTVVWDDVGARARGLSTHLLDRIQLERLTGSPDLPSLAKELDRLGYGPEAAAGGPTPATSAAGVERALRRGAAARLRTLRRWCGDRTARLAVLFEDEDRRSLRALLRGTVAGAAPEARLAGLIPTPSLPARALEELARQRTPAALATLLVVWGSPYGSVLLEEAERAHPDLLRLELALNRRFADRAVGAARRGGRALMAYVREVIDLENAGSAMVLAGGRSELPLEDCHLPGGSRLTLPAFLDAAGAPDRAAAALRLAIAFRATPFGSLFSRAAHDPRGIESRILRTQIREQARAARLAPLGPALFLGYVLRLRAEVMDLRRIAGSLSLGVPAAMLAEGWVSVT